MATLLAFSAEHVCRLTGLSMRQLRYWDDTGFFHPQYADEDRKRPHSRIYSFRDLVGLRVIARLAKEHKVPLQQLRRVGKWLSEQYEAPWSSLRFYVAGRKVYFDDPLTNARMIGEPHG
ncbi:MAG: MerR family transcriptional regulator, partial [Chloroflexota bacterium]